MQNFDYLNLDGNALRTFFTILEEKSVSRAAARLGASQSGVSHTLDKLRESLNDPLFVRAGRGIQATPRAIELGPIVENLLDNFQSLTHGRDFDPAAEKMQFIVAANDFPIQLIFPGLVRNLMSEDIHPEFRFIPSGVPSTGTLQTSRYDFIVTPAPPDSDGITKVPLLKSKMSCYYDAAVRKPPRTWQEFKASKFADVRFNDKETSLMVLPNIDTTDFDFPVVTVPNFSSLASFIKGTDRITIQIGAMKMGLLNSLDVSPLPVKTNPLTVYLVWHTRHHDDPAHHWMRERIIKHVKDITKSKRFL